MKLSTEAYKKLLFYFLSLEDKVSSNEHKKTEV